ncbi:MAG TPA: benzoate-CoA ligase family protein, partial [Hyphomicrobiales bacterium]|nr:benzoate-CoA ligase family protein [Hyphomicrobiales bacterium]
MTAREGNAALYFVDRHRFGNIGEKAAFIEAEPGGRTLTYRDLASQSDRMAALYRRHGLRPEDRAAMLLLDRIEFPIIFWGSLKAGVIPIPLNTLLSTEIYDAILRDSRARALFVSPELWPTIAPALADNPYVQSVFFVPQPGATNGSSLFGRFFGNQAKKSARTAKTYLFTRELSASQMQPVLAVSPDECAFWLYSSGSTGAPKGVRHVHSSLKYTADTYGRQVLGIEHDDVVFSAAKLFFAYGLGNSMTFPMSVGATTILFSGRPTPENVAAVIEKTQPTVFYGVPTLYAAMLARLEGKKPLGAERLRRCVSAGEALPAEVGERWRRFFGVDILDGVGSTELLHIFLSNRPGDVVLGTSGVAVPGYELRLVDEHGSPVAPGAIGELLVKGLSAADGYWNQREKTRQTFEGWWTRTGDKYELREDGRLIYCGRTDDMFKVSGIWVAPFEVEQALVSHAAVLEAAVVAQKDEDGLDKPKAYVVLKPGAQRGELEEALKEHVKDKIGKWKYPRWIEFIDELPKTATGKIQRFKLRAVSGVDHEVDSRRQELDHDR